MLKLYICFKNVCYIIIRALLIVTYIIPFCEGGFRGGRGGDRGYDDFGG